MWVTTPTLIPLIPITTNTNSPSLTFSPTFSSRRYRHHLTTVTASSKEITGLGQALLKAQTSSPSNKTSVSKGVNENNNNGNELNGSDILWALQKATAKKAQVKSNNKKVQKKNGSGVNLKKEDSGRVAGYDEVKPVVVKSDWSLRLNDLEKRIHEFISI